MTLHKLDLLLWLTCISSTEGSNFVDSIGKVILPGTPSTSCIATLISPSFALTSAHCFFEKGRPKPNLDKVYAEFGARTKCPIQAIKSPTSSPFQNRSYDYAFVQLTKPLGHELGYIQLPDIRPPSEGETNYSIEAFYHFSAQVKHEEECKMTIRSSSIIPTEYTLEHNCHLQNTSTGTPLLQRQTDRSYVLMGIHSIAVSDDQPKYGNNWRLILRDFRPLFLQDVQEKTPPEEQTHENSEKDANPQQQRQEKIPRSPVAILLSIGVVAAIWIVVLLLIKRPRIGK